MRRGLASLIIGLSLVLASISWAGFSLLRTALNPDKSEDIADLAFENEEIRQIIVSNFSKEIESRLPADSPLEESTLNDLTEKAIENPEVEATIRNYLVETHQRALRGEDPPETIRSDFVDEATTQLLGIDLPAEIPVDLSTSGLPLLGKSRSFLQWFTPLAALAAIVGAGIALFITQDRPRVLRRVAYWAFGTSLFWLVIGILIPKLLERVSPSSAAIATELVNAFFGSMITPAIVLALLGVALLFISKLWPKIASDKALSALGQSDDSSDTPLSASQQQNNLP